MLNGLNWKWTCEVLNQQNMGQTMIQRELRAITGMATSEYCLQQSTTALCWFGAPKHENFSLLLVVKWFNGLCNIYIMQNIKPDKSHGKWKHQVSAVCKTSPATQLIRLSLAAMIFLSDFVAEHIFTTFSQVSSDSKSVQIMVKGSEFWTSQHWNGTSSSDSKSAQIYMGKGSEFWTN